MGKVKDYNYETDIITTPDPIYGIGQRVYLGKDNDILKVESVVWDSLGKTWSYDLLLVGNLRVLRNVREKNLRDTK